MKYELLILMIFLSIHKSRSFSNSIRSKIPRAFFSVAVDTNSEVKNVPRKFVPYPFEYHEQLTLRVSSLTNLGMGVCKVPVKDDDNGMDKDWVIFVPNVIPGELVKVKIYRNHKTYSDADLSEIVEESKDRVKPVCSLSNVCGGCQYQHMQVAAQRQWKTQQVQDLLERIGGFSPSTFSVTPTTGTDDVYHYRSKITPHYDRPKKVDENIYEIREIGFKEKNTRRLVDVPYCHIATEGINESLTHLRQEIHEKARTGQLRRPKRGATLLLRDVDEGVITDPNSYVTTTVSGLKFRFLAGNFFQNNPHVMPLMVDHVVAAATKPGADGRIMTHLIDCYCGSGLFCLSSASSFDICVGIEINEKAIKEASANAALNEIKNCAFVAASAEAIFESDDPVEIDETSQNVRDFPRDSTVVVCDPPRKGCSEEFLSQLYEFQPQRIVYMSCDPATQARDAKGIVAAGYEITSVQPFDLFPQTRHIENLVIFERSTAQI